MYARFMCYLSPNTGAFCLVNLLQCVNPILLQCTPSSVQAAKISLWECFIGGGGGAIARLGYSWYINTVADWPLDNIFFYSGIYKFYGIL